MGSSRSKHGSPRRESKSNWEIADEYIRMQSELQADLRRRLTPRFPLISQKGDRASLSLLASCVSLPSRILVLAANPEQEVARLVAAPRSATVAVRSQLTWTGLLGASPAELT